MAADNRETGTSPEGDVTLHKDNWRTAETVPEELLSIRQPVHLL